MSRVRSKRFVELIESSMDRNRLWTVISELCEAEGVSLFDLETPGAAKSGVLKVFLHVSGGIQHSHCAAVSTRILNHALVEEILPGSTTLEVSSPGINRKLTRTEHFEGAVGERVKVSFRTPVDQKKTTVVGTLNAFDGTTVHITPEAKGAEQIIVPLQSVQEARIDFLFE